MAALAAEPRLERHEDARGVAVAGDALAQQQLDPGDDTATEPEVLGQRPLGERGLQPLPQRAIVLVAQPCGAVRGLEADKGEEGGWIGGVGEEVLGDDDVDDVVHCTRGDHD